MSELDVKDSATWHWQPWQAQEREDFFATIEKHRRLAWRVTAVCLLAYSILALVMSVLLAPLIYCVIGLVFDLLNLLIPMPDLLGSMLRFITALLDDPLQVALPELLKGLSLALLPGLVLMLWLGYNIASALKQPTWLNHAATPSDLSISVLTERQFKNVVEEMAIAALIPVPRVQVVQGGANAAALGLTEQSATILVGDALLKSLNRAQLQGVAAHLISSIAEHDVKIGLQTSTVMGVFSLIARFAFSATDAAQRKQVGQLWRAMFRRDVAGRTMLLTNLVDPFSEDAAQPKPTKDSNQLTWREWLSLPLMGPVFMSAFLGQFVNSLLLSPLISVVWRQRKYMADASAVKLTREPNTLASALQVLRDTDTHLLMTAWTSHFCVVQPGKISGLIIPMFPAIEKRLKALIRLGAEPIVLRPDQTLSDVWQQAGWRLVIIVVLGLIAAALIIVLIPMLVVVSMMLTLLMTLLPTALLHALLR